MNFRTITIFVSHPFVPDNPAYDIKAFRTNIELLVSKAENLVRKEYGDFEIKSTFIFNDFDEGLPGQIDSKIRSSHLGIVDITENKPNIFYEYGLMYGLNIPSLVMKSQASMTAFPLPADIKDRNVITYEKLDEIPDKMAGKLAEYFKQIIESNTLANVHLNKIWFPANVGTIHVIAPVEQEKTEFASLESKNYIFLNNVGDIDSVLQVTNFLARRFNNTNVCCYASDEFNKHFEENLVVIGGPGDDGEGGNTICAQIMSQMDVAINYCFDDPEDEQLTYDGKNYSANYDSKTRRIAKDWGYFARFPNPINPRSSVVLIHGIHTFGVLGAAKAFSDHPSAQANITALLNKLRLDDFRQASFECFFPVQVIGQSVQCPEIEERFIFPLKKMKK
ncbi:MAG: hypothetical protein ABI378_09370 [Chitinophagaceae bacterium]